MITFDSQLKTALLQEAWNQPELIRTKSAKVRANKLRSIYLSVLVFIELSVQVHWRGTEQSQEQRLCSKSAKHRV